MYASSNHHRDHLGSSLCTDAGHESIPSEETPLTQNEQRLKEILKTVSTESIIGFGIRRAIYKSTNGNTRKLIAELKDHYRDTPGQLMEVIGPEAMQIIALL